MAGDLLYEVKGARRVFQRGPTMIARRRRRRPGDRAPESSSRSRARAGPARRPCCSCSGRSIARAPGASSSRAATSRALGDGDLAELRLRAFGFVFQQFNLIPTLTALENVEAGLAPPACRGSRAARPLARPARGGRAGRRAPTTCRPPLRRRAAARGDRARARRRAARDPRRRADRQPRHPTGADVIELARRARRRPRHDHRRRHPRRGAGGARAAQPHDERRSARGSRLSAAGQAAVEPRRAGGRGSRRGPLRVAPQSGSSGIASPGRGRAATARVTRRGPEPVAHVVERRVERALARGARTAASSWTAPSSLEVRDARSRPASGPARSIIGVAAASSAARRREDRAGLAPSPAAACASGSPARSRRSAAAATTVRHARRAARIRRASRSTSATRIASTSSERPRPAARARAARRSSRAAARPHAPRVAVVRERVQVAARRRGRASRRARASSSRATSPTVVIPRACSFAAVTRPTPHSRSTGSGCRNAELAVGRHDEQAVGLGHRARHLGEELRPRHADRDRQADLLAHLAPQPHGDLDRRPGEPRAARPRRGTPRRSTAPRRAASCPRTPRTPPCSPPSRPTCAAARRPRAGTAAAPARPPIAVRTPNALAS